MQVSTSSKTIPPPGHDLKGEKIVPPGQSLCTKALPSGQNKESKATPRYINLENFTNVSINLTLFEMKSFMVSTNKTVFQ